MEKDVKIILSGKKTKQEPISKLEALENDIKLILSTKKPKEQPNGKVEPEEPKYATISEIKSKPELPVEKAVTISGTSTQTEPLARSRDVKNTNIKRSDSWQGSSKHAKAKQIHPHHYETRTSEIRHLDTFSNGVVYETKVKKAASTPESEFAPKVNPKNDVEPKKESDLFDKKVPIYNEIDRKDPKRITKRYIPRKKFANEENGNQEYEKVELLPPCQFRDAPPPPEAFRDPPEPIDNILYYVVESVNENREANRRRECEEKAIRRREAEEERKIAMWKKECGGEANVYKLAEYTPKWVSSVMVWVFLMIGFLI